MTRRNWSYRFTSEALVEEIDGKCRVYGRWGWRVGIWDVDFETGSWHEVAIDWPVYDRRGVWLEPEAIRGPSGCPVHAAWQFEARAAFAVYFSEIPVRVRRFAAGQTARQWLATLDAWKAPEANLYPEHTRHVPSSV